MNYTLCTGDVTDVLPTLQAGSFDACLCDPPYGLRLMGKAWDYDVPRAPVWREILRVLKPGSHLLAFAGARTMHRMATEIEDAGFVIRDLPELAVRNGLSEVHGHGPGRRSASGKHGQAACAGVPGRSTTAKTMLSCLP